MLQPGIYSGCQHSRQNTVFLYISELKSQLKNVVLNVVLKCTKKYGNVQESVNIYAKHGTI